MDRLSAYQDRVASMSVTEKDEHLRVNYTTSEHAWPDYLDYVDEWQWHFLEAMSKTRKDFIFCSLVTRRQRIQCGDHHHYFTDDSQDTHPEAVYFPRTDTFVEPTACWNVLLRVSDESLRSTRALQSSAQLTMPEVEYVRRLAGLRLLSQGLTPRKLSFEEFKTRWWNTESSATAYDIAHEQPSIADELGIVRRSLPPAKPQWIVESTAATEVILPSTAVAADHGLHAILLAVPDGPRVLKTINSVRKLDPDHDLVCPNQIAKAMETCPYCVGDTPKTGPTPTGVYYAPPGNGKTTCQDRHLFCGIDTDWLVKMSSFQHIIAPFLEMDLAVITNQYHLATNAGEKFIGLFSSHHLRKNLFGAPFTPESEIDHAIHTFSADLAILKAHGYLAENMLNLLRCNYIYRRAREIFTTPSPKRFKPYYRHNFSTWETFSHELLTWSSPYRGKNYQQNKRKRARFKELN